MSKMGFTEVQVRKLQQLLRAIYKTAKEANTPYNYQVVYVWSKMDLNDPDQLARLLILLRQQMTGILKAPIDTKPETLQLLQWLSDEVSAFYIIAHGMIDDLAAQEKDDEVQFVRDMAEEDHGEP